MTFNFVNTAVKAVLILAFLTSSSNASVSSEIEPVVFPPLNKAPLTVKVL